MQPQVKLLFDNIRKVIFGKDDVIQLALTALFARGHLLIEDAPGLGKTMLARAIAQSIRAAFKRIQFTPDLLPSDVTGVTVFDPAHQKFEFFRGPIFAQVLLADEINRTSPRTQSSLLESMEEGQVTIDGKTRDWRGRHFCPRCGSSVFARVGDEIELHLGTLDAPDRLMPTYECWTVRRESWLPPFPVKRHYERDREGPSKSE